MEKENPKPGTPEYLVWQAQIAAETAKAELAAKEQELALVKAENKAVEKSNRLGIVETEVLKLGGTRILALVGKDPSKLAGVLPYNDTKGGMVTAEEIDALEGRGNGVALRRCFGSPKKDANLVNYIFDHPELTGGPKESELVGEAKQVRETMRVLFTRPEKGKGVKSRNMLAIDVQPVAPRIAPKAGESTQ